MRVTKLFTKTRKQAPADEEARNAQLLIQAGFIHKEMAGVYTLLPLGMRVLEKIQTVIREEMDAVGGVQMKTSALQNKDVWEKTNRWSDNEVDVWFKTNLKNGTEVGLSFTNEEAYSSLMKDYISSYKDLPIYAYDFKTIFRNEVRSKSGIMRGREFYWKALYSFSKDKTEHDKFYDQITEAYKTIYNRLGIGGSTYITFASGGTFAKYSHEYQTVSAAGEDIIYIDEAKGIAVNKEVFTDEVLKDLGLSKDNLIEKKAIEVGNTFSLGTKFSEPFGLSYTDEKGKDNFVYMGSYGIGVTRLMGTITEVLSDEKGLVWPANIAPAQVYLARLGEDEAVVAAADKLYQELQDNDVEVLYDDRDVRAGEKFADADLIGLPIRLVVSNKSLQNNQVELKQRTGSDSTLMAAEQVVSEVKKSLKGGK